MQSEMEICQFERNGKIGSWKFIAKGKIYTPKIYESLYGENCERRLENGGDERNGYVYRTIWCIIWLLVVLRFIFNGLSHNPILT
jgi:hypothetical protein